MWVQNYYAQRAWVLWSLPYPAQVVIGLYIWRMVRASLAGQGTSRYTVDEIRIFRREIWDSLEALLCESKMKSSGGKPFWVLGGDEPTEADTTLFGTVAAHLSCPP